MKTKLEMAHEYAIALINSDCEMQFDKFIRLCWNYADAMQDEAEKREQQKQDKLKQDQQNHHDELVSIGLEEWQPDWSQAPEWANFIVMSKAGTSYWHTNEPKASGNGWVDGGLCDLAYMDFYHKGDWRDSLRKRPQ